MPQGSEEPSTSAVRVCTLLAESEDPQLCVFAHFRQSEREDWANSTDGLGEQNGTEGDT